MSRTGIILASFGSIYGEAVEKSLGTMERKAQAAYPDCKVRRVFLSPALVEKWNEKYEDKVETLEEALAELKGSGVEEVYIQPFALVADQSYQHMRKQLMRLIHGKERLFAHINIGKPLLTSLGAKNTADDYAQLLSAVERHIGPREEGQTLLLMANGQNHPEFSALQLKCLYGELPRTVVFTSNGFPTFRQALGLLAARPGKKVMVMPMALIGSEHLLDYLGGIRNDSVKSLLEDEGYQVSIWNEGLGENPYIQELFLKHLSRAIQVISRKKEGLKSGDCTLPLEKNVTAGAENRRNTLSRGTIAGEDRIKTSKELYSGLLS